MFRSGRWKSEKSAVKVVFKLRFHATKVQSVGDEGLIVSVIPADTGKTSAKSDKATVREGSCLWENPVYEAVKFNLDPKLGKFHERIYHFVVGTGSSKRDVMGEASIDLVNYIEANKVTLVSLPLKSSKSEAILNVSIQRMKESHDQRVSDESVDSKPRYKDSSLMSRMSNEDVDEASKSNSDDNTSLSKGVSTVSGHRASSGSDLTMSSSGSSSGVEIQWQSDLKCNDLDPKILVLEKRHNSDWEWLGNDTLGTQRESFIDEAPDIVVEKLKSEITALSRQVEISDMELQTLRKQIAKESKQGQGLFEELIGLKEERDSLKLECEKLRIFERSMSSVEGRKTLEGAEGDEYKAFMAELIQELQHEKEVNSELKIQLQKMQESNSEPVKLDCGSDDKEQKALEELVSQHGDVKYAYLLEQQKIRIRSELEIYKRDKDELEMQMEQLALDYEVMKQENYELVSNLRHIQLREELKTQCEYSSCRELEAQIERLEEKLENRAKETETAVVRIRELEAHISNLEDGTKRQAQSFEADLEHLLCCQEKRVLVAEESLRKVRLQSSKMVDQLQEEVRRLSMQMQSTFEANERVAIKALTEANELRLQKVCLEERIKIAMGENELIRNWYEVRLEQLVDQVNSLENETRNSQLENQVKDLLLQDQKVAAEETKRLPSDEILMLKEELKQVVQVNNEMKIKEDTFISTEKKMKHTTSRGTTAATSKSKKQIHISKEILNLKEKIKLLQDDINSKETDIETSNKLFAEKEKFLLCKIEELERTICALRQNSNHFNNSATQKVTDHGSKTPNRRITKSQEKKGDTTEMGQLKERNMEAKLKEIAGDIFRNKSQLCRS